MFRYVVLTSNFVGAFLVIVTRPTIWTFLLIVGLIVAFDLAVKLGLHLWAAHRAIEAGAARG